MRAIENEIANIFHRVIAFTIDYIIIIIINTIVALIFVWSMEKFLNFSIDLYIRNVVAASIVMFFVIFVTYFSLLDSNLYKGTVGKKYMNICVVNVHGNCLSVKKSFLRNIAKLILGFFLHGYLLIFLNSKRKALYDYVSKTIVIKR